MREAPDLYYTAGLIIEIHPIAISIVKVDRIVSA